ncbi:hypothetical protein ABZ667_20830 [Streptomyces lavendulae]|uniref:hypothetical protein n=1 Tax=Streptomyces lavendulae TaxID=1914 RepID=UPI0033F2698A
MRAAAATAGALALTAALTGCEGPATGAKRKAPAPAADRTAYSLGEPSELHDSSRQDSDGAKFTVTPTRVVTGTEADMDGSGLKKDASEGPQVPVFVHSTLTHKSGPAMQVRDMDDDLIVRTDSGLRTKALIVIMGSAKWADCPGVDDDKKLTPGQSEQVCAAFLIPANQKAAAVELSRGFMKPPLEWPVRN